MSFAVKKYTSSNQGIKTLNALELCDRRRFFQALADYCAQSRALISQDDLMIRKDDISKTEYFYSEDELSSLDEYECYISSLDGEALYQFRADYMKERS